MGSWGFGLYQNDLTLDIKDDIKDLFKEGKSMQEITEILLRRYRDVFGDKEEEPLFWFALADTQWSLGALQSEVKEKAFFWIEKCGAFLEDGDPRENRQKRKTLETLKVKLLSPQPPPKKPPKPPKLYQCKWKYGDVFAYRLESDLAKEKGWYGRYFLIRKVDEGIWYPGHIVPIVHIKITDGTTLPTSAEEYDRLEYVQVGFTRFEDRFRPIDWSRPNEDIAEKSKIHYEVDEYGFLPQYRVRLLNTSKRVIPTSLIYVGNFMSVAKPPHEFVPHIKVNIRDVAWKRGEVNFETRVLQWYCGHNLRELSVYNR